MSVSVFDSNKELRSILTKYDIVMNVSNKFDWYSLKEKRILRDDLTNLIRSIGLYCDDVILNPKNFNWRKYRIYVCQHCNKFELNFQVKPINIEDENTNDKGEIYVMNVEKYKDHSNGCNRRTEKIPSMMAIIEQSPKLIKLVRTASNYYDNKNKMNMQLLKDNLGFMTYNVEDRMLTRAIANLRKKFVNEIPNFYALMIPYLKEFIKKNPSAGSIVQVDSNNCFYRTLVSIPHAKKVFQNNCIPMFFIDGTFHNNNLYDGLLIQLSAKHGFGGVLPVIAAWMPVENKENFVFFLITMKVMGFDIEEIPFMTDRGPLLSAVRYLHEFYDIEITLKFCTEHIIRNIVKVHNISKSDIPTLRKIVMGCQQATNLEIYITNVDKLKNCFPMNGNDIVIYVMSIHPRHWCVMGNLEALSDNCWLPGYMAKLKSCINQREGLNDEQSSHVINDFQFYGNLPLGNKSRLFGISRNNVAESQANMAKINGIRSIIPPLSVKKWLECAMTVLTTYFSKVNEMWNKNIPYTSIAISAYENNSRRLKFLHIDKIEHSINVDIITISEVCNDRFIQRRCVVDQSNYTQCSCTYFQQYGTLCSHLMKCYIYLKHLCHVNAMTFEKWSQNIIPSYMKINNLHENMENTKITYDYTTDMYDFQHKCSHSTDINPPPSYKNNKSFTQQKRFKSKGEVNGGNTQPVAKLATKQSRITFAGKQTRVRYLNKKQIEQYSHLSQKGFFHIMNADKLDEMKNTINSTSKMDENVQHRECSYCKSMLRNGHDHNIRTCQKALHQGKSEFMDYNNGIFKLLHIEGITKNLLDKEFSVFGNPNEMNPHKEEQYINVQPDKVINVPDHNIVLSTNEVKKKTSSMITKKRKEASLTKHESKKRSKTSTNSLRKNQTMSPVLSSVKESIMYDKKSTEQIIIDYNAEEQKDTTTLKTQLKMIRWGIKAKKPYLQYINTCAVDSILFSIYYLVNKFPRAMEYIEKNCSGLNESINLMKNGNVDMARVTMINSTDKVNKHPKNPPIIDATSSIGDWLYYMKTLVKFDILTNVTCTSCNKFNNKTKVLLSIDMISITKDIQSEVTKRSEQNFVRDCCAADEIIDIGRSNGQILEAQCKGKMTTYTQFQNVPWLLTFLASTNTGTKLLFSELPKDITMCGKMLHLLCVIVKNDSHFRSILHVENEIWVSYDGMDTHYEIINTKDKDRNYLIDIQRKGYGICAAFYYNQCMKDNEPDETTKSVANIKENTNIAENIQKEMSSDDDSYNKYCKQINKCETYETPYAKNEDIDSDGDDKLFMSEIKRKMEPLRVGDIVRYKPYFDIGNKGDVEGMVVNVDKKKRQIMTSNLDLIDRMGVVQRIGCYNATNNTIEQQDGVCRYLENFKLCEESSGNLERKLTKQAMEKLHARFMKSLKKMKKKMKQVNPFMADFIKDR